MKSFPDWSALLRETVVSLGDGLTERKAFLDANGEAVERALIGISVDGAEHQPGVGGCVVVNISSANITALAQTGARYKNCYDLDQEARVGEKPRTSPKRIMVDEALAPLHGEACEQIYFAALEFNGCGISFYGDYCLVLRDDIVESETIILDRNSYDLIRTPFGEKIADNAKADQIDENQARTNMAFQCAGVMKDDVGPIATIKVLERLPPVLRRLTTGTISDGVLDDEDYIEVLRPMSFGVDDISEVRLSPADVALEERIRARSLIGQPPSQAEALWRERRRMAEARLAIVGVNMRVVTTVGRTRG